MIHFVTGGTGLIGGNIVQRLAKQGEHVRVLVRSSSNITELEQLNVQLVVGDLLDSDSIHRAMEGVGIVYHSGGLVSDWGKRSEFFDANVEGTRHVVQAAVSEGVERLVHVSSAAVYGYPKKLAVSESEPFDSKRIPYIESKIAGERIVQRAIEEQRLDAVMLRPVMVFGPKCHNYVGEIVHHLKQGSMLLLDGGRHVAGLAYVENVAAACLLAGRARHTRARVFNICDDSPITWKQYIAALADGIGMKCPRLSLPTWFAFQLAACMEATGRMLGLRNRPLLTRLAVLELGQTQSYDISLARRQLGYVPSVDFETAMQRTLEWVRTAL